MSGSYCNIHIANTPCDGGAYVPSPYAVPDDGELDAIFMCSNNKIEIARAVGDRNKGWFEKHDSFKYYRCKNMEVLSDAPLSINIDGECLYARDIKLSIVPKGIKIFAPEGMGFADYSHRGYKSQKSNGGKP
jgi:diacylglycerol kinase family enzyme